MGAGGLAGRDNWPGGEPADRCPLLVCRRPVPVHSEVVLLHRAARLLIRGRGEHGRAGKRLSLMLLVFSGFVLF